MARRHRDGRVGGCRTTALLTLACAVLPAAAAAQGPISVTLRGRIVDGRTSAPVEGVFVTPYRDVSGVLTDSAGFFALRMAPSPSYVLTAEGLGYVTMHVELPATAPDEVTTLRIEPDPLQIQGLTVLVDRFQFRRRSYFGTVRVLDASTLRRRGAGLSARDLVIREIPFARPCRNEYWSLCTYRRGGERQVRICIDEQPAWGGATDLDGYDGGELYLIEVYGWGDQVRVYTRWYVDRLVRSGQTLRPLGWTC